MSDDLFRLIFIILTLESSEKWQHNLQDLVPNGNAGPLVQK